MPKWTDFILHPRSSLGGGDITITAGGAPAQEPMSVDYSVPPDSADRGPDSWYEAQQLLNNVFDANLMVNGVPDLATRDAIQNARLDLGLACGHDWDMALQQDLKVKLWVTRQQLLADAGYQSADSGYLDALTQEAISQAAIDGLVHQTDGWTPELEEFLKDKKELNMSDNTTAAGTDTTAAATTAPSMSSQMADNLKQGVKFGLAMGAAEVTQNAIIRRLIASGVDQKTLDNPLIKILISLGGPSVLLVGAHFVPGIPARDAVINILATVQTASAANLSKKAVVKTANVLLPIFEELASLPGIMDEQKSIDDEKANQTQGA